MTDNTTSAGKKPSRKETKTEELVRARRRQIFEAAAKVFARKGFHAAKVSEIAVEAGLGKGTLYEYVSSKHELLYLVMEEGHSMIYDVFDRIMEMDLPPEEKLFEAVRSMARVIEDYREAARALFPEIIEQDGNDPRMTNLKLQFFDRFKRFFDECVKAGIYPDTIDGGAFCELLGMNIMQWGKSDTLRDALGGDVSRFEALIRSIYLDGVRGKR